jgi:metallophosphoesterase superfamily enzyme
MKTQAGAEVRLHAFLTSAQMKESGDEKIVLILPGIGSCSSSLQFRHLKGDKKREYIRENYSSNSYRVLTIFV